MAFKTKTEYFGLGTVTNLDLISVAENKTSQSVEALGANGYVIANQVFGTKIAPSAEYALKGNVTLSSVKLGSVTTVDAKKIALLGINISTSAGAAPTMSVNGQEVSQENLTGGCKSTLPAISISGLHHAQTFGAFTITGTGAHLTACSLAAQVSLSTAEKDGETIAHDVSDGRITITGTIQVSDSAYGEPTITPADGYVITAPLTCSNPNGDFPTYTFSLVKYLTADEA